MKDFLHLHVEIAPLDMSELVGRQQYCFCWLVVADFKYLNSLVVDTSGFVAAPDSDIAVVAAS